MYFIQNFATLEVANTFWESIMDLHNTETSLTSVGTKIVCM